MGITPRQGSGTTPVRLKRERAILVGVAKRDIPLRRTKEHLEELARLADTAGADVVEKIMQRRDSLDAATVVGQGKVKEISVLAMQLKADLVIFDEDLTGSQIKNLEKEITCKILDRSGIILDIFARHARTADAKIQVEVAQLEYSLPRLTNAWTHLSRQAGGVGIGMKGPGETQLETDRRLVRKRIADLKKKLEKMDGIRGAQHDRRIPLFHASLVGYTNAGKSTLMNSLTQAGVLAVDRLFATLDPTTRQLFLGRQRKAVLSDTVGFIRKLPPGLVSSFRSTLGVVSQASCIVNVVDATSSDREEQMEITAKVLSDLGVAEIPQITVFNKIDLLDPEHLEVLREHHAGAVFVSAERRLGLDDLRAHLGEWHDRLAIAPVFETRSPKEPLNGSSDLGEWERGT